MSYSDSERIRAKRRALYILGARDHSKKELYDKLIKNYPADLCDMVVDMMVDLGYIDEEKYAEKLYRQYMNKGWGKSKIRFELRRRGLPDSLIRENEAEYESEDFIEKIKELIEKKYINKLDFSDRDSVMRATAALARRGYGYEDIKLALSMVEDELEEEE